MVAETIDVAYILDGASHTVGRRKLKPDCRRLSFPQSPGWNRQFFTPEV